MSSLKRKSILSCLSKDFEEEDEWEKEASSSSSSIKRKPYSKPQPNFYAKQIATLDGQHVLLSKKERELAKELENLLAAIERFDIQEQELKASVDQSKQEYLDSIQNTISMIKNNKQAENVLESDTDVNYWTYDEFLSKEMDQLMQQWKETLTLGGNKEEIEEKIKSLEHDFKNTEFDVIDLIAQINGYEARIQSLNRDRAKLNSLPQILLILQSDTEKYKLEMKNTTQLLDKLEKESIRPYLKKLSELKISLPLRQDQYLRDTKLMQDLLSDLGEIYKIAMKQRACQELVSCVDDREKESTDHLNTLKLYASTMEDRATAEEIVGEGQFVESKHLLKKSDEIHAQLIKNLLNKFFESRKNSELFTPLEKENMTLVNQINALKEYEQKLRNKWEQGLQACLNSAQQLSELQSRLSETIFVYSDTKDKLVMSPRSYTDLQKELEFRSAELQVAISQLQKNVEEPDKNALFQQQKRLFSLFFSDPESFIDLFEKTKKYELDQERK